MVNGTACEFSGGLKTPPTEKTLLVPLVMKPEPAMELLARVDRLCDGAASHIVKIGALREDLSALAHTTRGGRFQRVLAVSLGEAEKLDAQKLRAAAGSATRWLIAEKIDRVCLWIDGLTATPIERAVPEWCTGMTLAGFRFSEHRATNGNAPLKMSVRIVAGTDGFVARVMPQVEHAATIAEAVNYTRALAQQPANVINPATLAAEACKLAAKSRMKCQILDDTQLRRLKMNGLLAVGQGARHGPCLIRLDYRPAPRSRVTTVLVGKAITFDTGGYSIKPSQGLEGLKFDKTGGATVMGVMRAIAALKLKCNVIGLIAAAENAISDRAYRPGDILRMMSGKTVEVISTDAEGRLILADALWYAQKHCKPTVLIDVATLTGGIGVTLGKLAAGLMSNDDALAGELGEAGRRTHERLWRLPLWDDYRELIKGTDADIKNAAASRDAHAIVGGMFLKEFINDGTRWAHLDIAAVATQDNSDSSLAKGATGFGVRLLVDYLQHRAT